MISEKDKIDKQSILNQLKIKHSKYIVNITPQIQNELNNQQNMCYICCGDLSVDENGDDEVVIKTKCNHYYHYNCLLQSALNKPKYYGNSRQECPYCRSTMGWFPKLTENQSLVKYIHKEYNYSFCQPVSLCQAVVKSGKKKGMVCGCKVKTIGSKLCGRHKNYKFPIVDKKENIEDIDTQLKEYKQKWFLGKILTCY